MQHADTHDSGSATGFSILQWLSNGGLGWLLGIIPLSLVIWFFSMLGTITSGEVIRIAYNWIPSLNITLSFAIDGLSLLFAIIVSGVGTMVVVYAGGYMAGDAQIGRFFLYLFLFMGAMLGLILADNIITMFVFWELTSITSYLLIGFKHNYATSRTAALQALLVTGSGGLALLAGLIMLAFVGGSFEISEIIAAGPIHDSALYTPILVLVVLGAFTKSAQFPFHFWLPGAMAAPTPVSAYLHSATMVKAGVYLLARMSPVLGGTPAWQITLMTFGAITMFLGAYVAVFQVDLKRILAFTTISALGTLVMLIGIGTEYAIRAAIVFLVVHSLYKGCLFMVAGAIDHETGTRDISGLGGLRKLMPITAVAAGLAALSMSGIPPLYGFIGKEVMYEATLEAEMGAVLVTTVAVASNMLMIVSAGLVAIKPFFGVSFSTPKKAHEPPASMLFGPVALAVISLLLGIGWAHWDNIVPGSLAEPISNQAVGAILAANTDIHIYLIPSSLSLKVFLSALTIAVGLAGYFYARDILRQSGQQVRGPLELAPERAYTAVVEGMQMLARWQTRVLQSGYLRYYMLTVVATVVLVAGYTLLTFADFGAVSMAFRPVAAFHEWMVALSILAGTIFTVLAKTRLAAITGLGIVGYGVALVFILNSAPDLAMTQFSVETLSVILFVLVLYRLPKFMFLSDVGDRIRDAVVALLAGALMTVTLLVVLSFPLDRRLSPYFAENSYEIAHGRNVVNVILVDFRALDTMGELAVIGIAAMGILVLMKLRSPRAEREETNVEEQP